MIRPILKFGDSVLHGKARTVDAFTPDIDRLIDDMIETMYAAPGVGLAATQVGVPLRVFVVDVSVGRDPNGLLILVNLQDASLSPKAAWDAIGYEVSQHLNGTISSVVYMSPVADRRFGRATTPIWLSGSCVGQAGIDAALLHQLCVGWDAFVSDGQSRVISGSAAQLEKWPEPPEAQR